MSVISFQCRRDGRRAILKCVTEASERFGLAFYAWYIAREIRQVAAAIGLPAVLCDVSRSRGTAYFV